MTFPMICVHDLIRSFAGLDQAERFAFVIRQDWTEPEKQCLVLFFNTHPAWKT